MIRWKPEDWPAQHSADGRYAIVKATDEPPNFVAYHLCPPAIGINLGERKSAEECRQLCESHARGQ